MAMTPGDILKRLANTDFQPRLIPGGEGVGLTHYARHHQNAKGGYELPMEIRLDPGGSFLKIIGPCLQRGGRGAAADAACALPEALNAFHLLRFVGDAEGGWLRPVLEYPCLPGDAALSDAGLCTLVGWAAEMFDSALAYLDLFARTGRRHPELLMGEPQAVKELREEIRDLQARAETAERQIDRILRPRVGCSYILPKFI